jgi:hypothetical protein
MDMEQFGLRIIRKEDIKEIDAYENDEYHKNIYYCTLKNKEKLYLIEIPISKLLAENKATVHEIIRNKQKSMLRPLYLINKSLDSSYLCYEFTDILLSKYIIKAIPDLITRLSLLKQATEYLLYYKKMNLALDSFNGNYIFIEGLDNPFLRILYHGMDLFNS